MNDYDWLGAGFYCWEQNELRAKDFAHQALNNPQICRGTIRNPAVLGVLIDLGNCLNLLDAEYIGLVKTMHTTLKLSYEAKGLNLPTNKGGDGKPLRRLDCFVIEELHRFLKSNQRLAPFDTVRGMFPEGKELYEGAGVRDKNHIQICIRNENCIKAFFDPRKPVDDPFGWIRR